MSLKSIVIIRFFVKNHVCVCTKSCPLRHKQPCHIFLGCKLKDLLQRYLAGDGALYRLEPIGLTPSEESRLHGLTISTFTHCKCLCWEETRAENVSSTSLSKTATSAGSGLQRQNREIETSETYTGWFTKVRR